jgi:hypothetical protein
VVEVAHVKFSRFIFINVYSASCCMAEVTDSGDVDNNARKTDEKPQSKAENESSELQDEKEQEEGSANESEYEIDQIIDAKRGIFSGVGSFFSKYLHS